ncbi:MAG: lysophospholipid acyltransferase family protein [Bacteroidia bacterium]
MAALSSIIDRILYYGLWLLSILPFFIWYRISELLYLIIYWILGYRRKVVRSNISRAFPEKSLKEIKRIERRFYLHLCDLLIETIKGVSMGKGAIQKRMKLTNPEIVDAALQAPKGTIVIASHYGNFEWANAAMSIADENLPSYTIYHGIKNQYFERLMRRIRSKHGSVLIEKQQAFRAALRHLQSPGFMGFVSDQSPSRRQQLYFTRFMGIPTAVHEGASILAVGRAFPAIFADIQKIKRGYYTVTAVPIPVEAFVAGNDIHGFTDFHADLLEARISKEPAFWLWSHRRWKHSPRDGDTLSKSLE